MSLYVYKAVCTRVIDGDTIDCSVDLGFGIYSTMRFRLENIDTAETWRPKTEAERAHGEEAKLWLANKIEGEEVTIKTDKDKHGKYRWLCSVYDYTGDTDDILAAIVTGVKISLNEEMVQLGFEKRSSYSDV